MKFQKICILGGTGFVGRHIIGQLYRKGVVSKILTRHPQRHRALAVTPGVRLVEADVFDAERLKKEFRGCDAVVNLVGILNQSGSESSFKRVHVELVDLVVQACHNAEVGRLLHMSALRADEARGASLYLRTKGEGENRAHTLGSPDIAVTSFRPSVIFGPGDSFFNRFAALLRLAPLVFPLACPRALFAPVYVGDVARAFALALDDPRTFGEHYALCGPKAFTLRQLVEYTARTLGMTRYVVGLNDRLSRLQARVMGFLPGTPFSYDNYLSLSVPSICAEQGLDYFGIRPTGIDAVVPSYLAGQNQRRHLDALRRH